jgi:valyl-tRNA synthetase
MTLYTVLVTVSKLIAPFMPFLSDFIFRDITGKESVHLEDWSQHKEHDENALSQMAVVRQMVELGLSLRKEKNLKVRQPLLELAYEAKDVNLPQEMEVILAEELNVKKVSGQWAVDSGQWGTKEGQNLKVGLNLTITEELKKEGWARELERQVQDLRKKSGMKVGELVDLYYNIDSPELETVLLSIFDRKKTYVSQISKSLEVEPDYESQSQIDGGKVWMGIVKT